MYRDITIHAALNGWQVQVGCQSVVFTDIDGLLNALRDYYRDPEGTEKKFQSTDHAKHVLADLPRAGGYAQGEAALPCQPAQPTPPWV